MIASCGKRKFRTAKRRFELTEKILPRELGGEEIYLGFSSLQRRTSSSAGDWPAPNPSSSSPITGARPDDSPAIARSPAPSRVSLTKLTPLFPFASSPQELIDLAPTSAAPNPLRILPLLTAIIDSGRPSSPAPSLLLQLHFQAEVHCYFNCVWLVPAAEALRRGNQTLYR
ncbi:hypothetical protein ACLOJK_021873 [Asimina triloba]